MAVRYGTKDKKGHYNANAISPLLQIAKETGLIWEKITKIFEMADNYQLKGQRAPAVKKGSLPHSRLTMLSSKVQDAPSTTAVNRSALSSATSGNLSDKDKCELLDRVINREITVKDLDNGAFHKKAFNTMLDYLLQHVFPSVRDRDTFDWGKAQIEYPELTQSKVSSFISSFTRTVGRRNKMTFPEAFEKFVKGLVNQHTRTRRLDENEEEASQDCWFYTHEFAKDDGIKWRSRGFVFRGSVMLMTEFKIQKRDYQMVIMDAPYGWGMANWDVVSAFGFGSCSILTLARCGPLRTTSGSPLKLSVSMVRTTGQWRSSCRYKRWERFKMPWPAFSRVALKSSTGSRATTTPRMLATTWAPALRSS